MAMRKGELMSHAETWRRVYLAIWRRIAAAKMAG
jgi:hypothetical protein